MALTKLEENLNTIENLPDSPTLEPDELKREFDKSSILIKKYINEILTVEIDKLISSTSNEIKKMISSSKEEFNKKINDSKTEINKTINNSNKNVEDKIKQIYHVGKIIIDTKNINPSTYLGFGNWQYWGSGRVPVGVNMGDSSFNAVEKAGGAKTSSINHNHTLGDSAYAYISAVGGAGAGVYGKYKAISNKYSGHRVGNTATTNNAIGYVTPLGGNTNNNSTNINIVQPYITCYMWKRIS